MTQGRTPVTFDKMRQAIARRMVQSKQSAPHFYVSRDLEMDAAMDALAAFNEGRAKEERATVTGLLLKAIASTLTAYPAFNAVWNGETLERVDAINLGVAIDLGDAGLIAPCLLDCASKSVDQLGAELRDLVSRAKVGRLKAPEIADGTFASEEPLDVLRERLQAAGVSVETSNAAQPGTPLEYPRSTSHDPAAVDRLVARLVGDEQVTEEPPPLRPVDPVTVAARCQQAVAQAQTLWLEFHDGGATLTHLVEPFELRAGMLSGWSLSAGRTITVALSRIAALGDAA